MTVSQAIGLCPALTLCEPDPVHYDEQFTRLLLALEDASPVIEPAELGRVFVGVDGLDGLYGGPEEQLMAVTRAMGRDGKRETGNEKRETKIGNQKSSSPPPASYRPIPPRTAGAAGEDVGSWASVTRLGWGRGKFLAWVAATRAKPGAPVIVDERERATFLANQPVAVLPIDTDTHRRLQQLGLHTLGDVARLPEAAIVSQFGAEGRRAWRLAAGRVTDAVAGRDRPEPIVAAFDLPTPVADLTMLGHALRKLIQRALNHPRRLGWRVAVVRVRAALEHGASWMTEVVPKDPSVDVERLAAPIVVRLEQSPPAGAVAHLAVEFAGFARGTDELQLFARDAGAAARAGRSRALTAAAREIRARLKRPLLHHIVEVQPWSRLPERRYALIDFEP
jgi:hypothetical protein